MSKLYKKDYVKIAGILNYAIKYTDNKVECVNYIISELIGYFQTTNSQFNSDTFKKAVLK